jgi:hypothetical protein
MSDPKQTDGAEVDPSEGSIDERAEPQGARATDGEGEGSAALEVDPSEGPADA